MSEHEEMKENGTPEEVTAEVTAEDLSEEEDLSEKESQDSTDLDGVETVATEPLLELDPLQEMTAQRDEYKEKWLRMVAELDNVRKRASRELIQSRRFSQADVLRSFLEVQDNVERALQSVPEGTENEALDNFRNGVELISQSIRRVLGEKGVEPMDAMGVAFDPEFHEAVGKQTREGVDSEVVIEVVQTGYSFGDMVLRPARVIISD